MKNTIEFRKDLVSGDWVLISTKIQKKPVFFSAPRAKALPKSNCPFEDSRRSKQENSLLWLPKPDKHELKDWWVQIFQNKYPVVLPSRVCPDLLKKGIFYFKEGVGFQEVVVTRDHTRSFGSMTKKEIEIVLESFITRYWALREEPCVEYILIIHNHGSRAGATVPHPHSQIFAIPIIPPDVSRSIEGSRSYFNRNKKCVHCDMLDWELHEKQRIIFETDLFVVLAPYASRVPFEVRIFPKIHESRFEVIDQKQRNGLAETMKNIFSRIKKTLKDPDYNFFIHTATPKDARSSHYHWHLEIIPRLSTWGGLELGAGIDVVKVSPEEAARILKKT